MCVHSFVHSSIHSRLRRSFMGRTFEDKNAVLWSCIVTSSGMSGTIAPIAAMNTKAVHWNRMKSHSLVERLYSPTRSS